MIFKGKLKRKIVSICCLLVLVAGFGVYTYAQPTEGYATISGIDTLWVLIAAFMVFLMQAGFGMLEAGLIRTKNTCNVLMNNFLDFCMASTAFFLFGYAFMFGKGNGFMGLNGWCLINATHEGTIPLEAAWLFHAVFCGAAEQGSALTLGELGVMLAEFTDGKILTGAVGERGVLVVVAESEAQLGLIRVKMKESSDKLSTHMDKMTEPSAVKIKKPESQSIMAALKELENF